MLQTVDVEFLICMQIECDGLPEICFVAVSITVVTMYSTRNDKNKVDLVDP